MPSDRGRRRRGHGAIAFKQVVVDEDRALHVAEMPAWYRTRGRSPWERAGRRAKPARVHAPGPVGDGGQIEVRLRGVGCSLRHVVRCLRDVVSCPGGLAIRQPPGFVLGLTTVRPSRVLLPYYTKSAPKLPSSCISTAPTACPPERRERREQRERGPPCAAAPPVNNAHGLGHAETRSRQRKPAAGEGALQTLDDDVTDCSSPRLRGSA